MSDKQKNVKDIADAASAADAIDTIELKNFWKSYVIVIKRKKNLYEIYKKRLVTLV